jgi:hypothetical protein
MRSLQKSMVAALALAACSCPSFVLAGGASSSDAPVEEPSAQSASHEVGMRVYLDPETGMLSPVPVTPEQMVEDEMFQASKATAPMEEIRRADGTVTVRLNGNFEVASQIVIGADGRRMSLCTQASHASQAPHVHLPDFSKPEER